MFHINTCDILGVLDYLGSEVKMKINRIAIYLTGHLSPNKPNFFLLAHVSTMPYTGISPKLLKSGNHDSAGYVDFTPNCIIESGEEVEECTLIF